MGSALAVVLMLQSLPQEMPVQPSHWRDVPTATPLSLGGTIGMMGALDAEGSGAVAAVTGEITVPTGRHTNIDLRVSALPAHPEFGVYDARLRFTMSKNTRRRLYGAFGLGGVRSESRFGPPMLLSIGVGSERAVGRRLLAPIEISGLKHPSGGLLWQISGGLKWTSTPVKEH